MCAAFSFIFYFCQMPLKTTAICACFRDTNNGQKIPCTEIFHGCVSTIVPFTGRVLPPIYSPANEQGCQSFAEPALSTLPYNPTRLGWGKIIC